MPAPIGWLKHLCEYLGGERDEPPLGVPLPLWSPIWGLWWGTLLCVAFLFCGQASKFIYIDF
ncbi:hypothetical protein [Gemmata sp.]|uniref:hypothetical protein n=1 Tax=Gemmata sp. TaxID=1914242 RepID=UPI003F72991D